MTDFINGAPSLLDLVVDEEAGWDYEPLCGTFDKETGLWGAPFVGCQKKDSDIYFASDDEADWYECWSSTDT